MSICPVDSNGYCKRHQQKHVGGLLRLALDPSNNGESYRLKWDRESGDGHATSKNAEVPVIVKTTPLDPQPHQNAGLGDLVESALSSIGITKDRIERWVGRPCDCQERQRKLNAIGAWAGQVASGKIKNAKEFLEGILQNNT